MIRKDEVQAELRELPRLFMFEPGWQIARKTDSIREYCYAMAPGADHYHRLLDGEVYLVKADEKLCLPCAGRRGLLAYDPKPLREPIAGLDLAIEAELEGFDVLVRRTEEVE